MKNYKVQNCNYILMDKEKKEDFTKKYIDIFNNLTNDDTIVFTVTKNEIFYSFIGSEKIEPLVFARFVELARNVREVSKESIKKYTTFSNKVTFRAECSLWNKEIPDDIISLLTNEDVTIRVLVTALPKEESCDYVMNKMRKNGFYKDTKAGNKIIMYDHKCSGIDTDWLDIRHKVMTLKHNLYRIKLEITVSGETEIEVTKKIDEVINKVKEYGIELNKVKDRSLLSTFSIFKNKEDGEDGVCHEDVIGKLIPFTTAECNDDNGIQYGINAVSGTPVVFDRKRSNLPHGLILSGDKSQRKRIVWNEINQIQKDADNAILIIDPFNEYKDENKIIKRIVCFGKDSKYHINPMDCYYDGFHGDGICDVSDTVTGFFEGVFGRDLNAYEVNILHKAVYEIMSPFITYLKENCLSHDFGKNPTLKDLLKVLEKEHEKNRNLRKKQINLAEKIKNILPDGSDSELESLVCSINKILDGPEVKGVEYKLFEDIETHKDELERFCFTTNIPEDINVCLTLDDNEPNDNGISKGSLSVFARYASFRIVINHEKMIADTNYDLRTWVYIEDISPWFSIGFDEFLCSLLHLIKRSRILCGIVTICGSSLRDILSNQVGISIINNTGFQRFGSLCYDSYDKVREIFCGLSKKEVDLINEDTTLFYNNGTSAIPCRLS